MGFRLVRTGHNCQGSSNPAWKGGRVRDTDGYILIHRPDHPYATSHGYVREHRLVAEQVLGRYLLPSEVVHHKNDETADNAPDNLKVYETNAKHLAETLAGKIPRWTEEGRNGFPKEFGSNVDVKPSSVSQNFVVPSSHK